MRTLFVICTAVTVLQVLDVFITGVKTQKPTNPLKTSSGTVVVTNEESSRTTTRALKKGNPTKPANNAGLPNPVDNEPGTNPNDDDSAEGEPPKTIKESSKRVVKTIKRMATNKGVGILNGFTGFLKKTGGALNFFGNFLRDRSNNVKDVAKESLATVSSFSDSSANGAKHLLKSGRVIGTQVGKEMHSTLQTATRLGTNVVKFGGSTVDLPLSIGADVVGTANRLIKVPSQLSKTVTNGVMNPILNYVVPESKEENPEEEEEEEEEEKEEPPKPQSSKVPAKPTQNSQKQMPKK